MRHSRAVLSLCLLVATLAIVASVAGLVWQDGGRRTAATSVRGEDVDLYGEGLYRYDTVFIATGSRGTDVVTLVLAVPLLAVALVLHRRGSARGALLVAGALGYFVYVYASRSLGNAYNGLFLAYVALFSASLFAFVVTVTSTDLPALAARVSARRRWRDLAAFLLASAAITTIVWLAPLVTALARRDAPERLDTYTTNVTEVLDLGVLVPTLVVAAALVLRRAGLGYLLAVVLLVLLVLVAATIIAGTVFQAAAGVAFAPGEVVGPIAGFLVLAAVGIWLLTRLLREVPA